MVITVCLLYKTFFALRVATFLCFLFMCMLHLAILEKCLSQYLHLTWWSWWLVSKVTWSRDTCGSAWTCVSVTMGCSISLCSQSCSSSFRYSWHSSHFLCKLSRWLLKSQGNMNPLLHILHNFKSFLWYLIKWLCLYGLLLKKWWQASHSLLCSSVQTSEPFTSSNSTCWPIPPVGTSGSFVWGSFCANGDHTVPEVTLRLVWILHHLWEVY